MEVYGDDLESACRTAVGRFNSPLCGVVEGRCNLTTTMQPKLDSSRPAVLDYSESTILGWYVVQLNSSPFILSGVCTPLQQR